MVEPPIPAYLQQSIQQYLEANTPVSAMSQAALQTVENVAGSAGPKITDLISNTLMKKH